MTADLPTHTETLLRRTVQVGTAGVGLYALVGLVTALVGTDVSVLRLTYESSIVVGCIGAAAILQTSISLSTWMLALTVFSVAVCFPEALHEDNSGRALLWTSVPVTCMTLFGRARDSRIGLAISLASLVAYFSLFELGVFPEPPGSSYEAWHRGINAIVLVLCLYAVGVYGARAFRRAQAEMKSTLDRLEQEVLQHQHTQAELQQAHRQVIETARVAGMAEVATGVLHNVGNALNTVVVTSQVVRDRVADTALERRLERLATLLEKSETDPALLVRYVEAMARQAATDRVHITNDMDRLRDAVSHVTQVVSAQQAHARSRGVVEEVSASSLLAEVAQLARPVVERHGVYLTVDCEHDPMVVTERHQVVQVLENLVRNAAEALSDEPRKREIRLNAVAEHGYLRLRVIDNGPGIPSDVRDRVFQHGFTTKSSGSGFGLHVSALASKAVGGRLDLDDTDEGTSFSLWLPVRRGSAVPSLAPWDEAFLAEAQEMVRAERRTRLHAVS